MIIIQETISANISQIKYHSKASRKKRTIFHCPLLKIKLVHANQFMAAPFAPLTVIVASISIPLQVPLLIIIDHSLIHVL